MSVRALRRGTMAGQEASEPVVPNTTYTLFGTQAGAQDGYVQAAAGAADGGGAGANPGGIIYVGQSSATGYEGFIVFDTSAVEGVITSATLSLWPSDDSSQTEFTMEARAYDWGPTLTVDDWRSRASLAALPLLASRSTVGLTIGAYNSFISDPALLAAINRSGSTGLVLCSDRHRLGIAGGTEYVGFYSSGAAGTAQDPKLVIESYVDYGTVAPIPTYVGASSGGANGVTSVNTTRPVGTAVGDHLILAFHVPSSDPTPPVLAGWTKLSGYNLEQAKFAIYDRIATLTSDDEPVVAVASPGSWYGGWVQVAIRGGATISGAVANTHGQTTSIHGPIITPTRPNALILSIVILANNGVVSPFGQPPGDRYHANANYYGVGVATEDKELPQPGLEAIATNAGYAWMTYALALTGP